MRLRQRIPWALSGMVITSGILKTAGRILANDMEEDIFDFYDKGFVIPIVNVDCSFKKSLRYGDTVIVETEFIPCDAAKIKFSYRLFNKNTKELVATGNSVQVFLRPVTFSSATSESDFF